MSVRGLVETESRNRAILESSPDAIITVDPGGMILDLNPAAEQVLGSSSSEAFGRPWLDFIITDQDATSPSAWQHFICDAESCAGGKRSELTALAAGGIQFPVEITISPVRLPTVTLYAIWLRDITERRSLENQLWRSQKMEAVGRLAGGVAHDFNNLLTVITGYSDLVLASLAANDPRRSNVEEVLKAGERAASLTRQLLAFSRRQVLAPQPLDLNDIVRNLNKMLTRLIGEDIDVLNALAPGLWTVRADPGQIEQVLVNLAVNARDAMPAGGSLTIETANVAIDVSNARQYQPPMPAGDYVLLAVSDNGCGMDQKTLSLIFEPFFTTKEEGRGTGLGLSTVYGIVKQSGGFIWVYSEPGHGASFKIYLPRVPEENANSSAAELEEGPQPKGLETILVVEDECAVRGLVRGVLESAGYTVLEAANGEDAIRIAATYEKPIDLLLTDVVMPQIGGRQLAKMIEAMDPKIRIIYMSGYAEKAIVHHGILEHGAVLLQKPFAPYALVKKVREELDKDRRQ